MRKSAAKEMMREVLSKRAQSRPLQIRVRVAAALLTIVSALLGPMPLRSASAAPILSGQWDITFYWDPPLVSLATVAVCFDPSTGKWYSVEPAVPDWAGRFFQKGNDVVFAGNLQTRAADGFVGSFVSPTLVTGLNAEWDNTFSNIYQHNRFKAVFVKSVCDQPAVSVAAARTLPAQRDARASLGITAVNLVGQWNFAFYKQPNLGRSGIEGICLTGTGTWYSTTRTSWSGVWHQNEDTVWVYGDVDTSLRTVLLGMIDSKKALSGAGAEWTYGGQDLPTFVVNRWRASFRQSTCDPPK